MTYIVLARKWRPMLFNDVIGQDHVTKILMNALKNGRIAHAYIFAGPRGVGKTTTARLLAKAVNCENQPVINPCNECASCKSITDGRNMDVVEIDGASNRGIDEIRNLRENIRFAPVNSKYKIYIIDEVHMLTKEAFNALLKTLEEPPTHALFIFATTEIHKVPLTILSRCQRFDFKRINIQKIQDLLKTIAKSEKIKIDNEALFLIARKADGSMRDAESILDQMISSGSGKITTDHVRQSLGLIDQEVYFEFTDLLKERHTDKILEYASRITGSGHDLLDYLYGMQEHFRNILLSKSPGSAKILAINDFYRKRYQETAQIFEEKDLIHFIQILLNTEQSLKFSTFPELNLEMLLLKLAYKPPSSQLEELMAFIEKVKKKPKLLNRDIEPRKTLKHPIQQEIREKNISNTLRESETKEIDTIPSKKNMSIADNRSAFGGLKKTLSNFQNLNKAEIDSKEQANNIEIDFKDVRNKWDTIVQKVRNQKVALGSFLQEGIPYELEKEKIIIAYDKNASFHQEHVEKNKKMIEEIFQKEFQFPVRLGFKTIDFQKSGIQKEPRTPEEIIEDIKNKEPIIRKIIDAFELENVRNK